MSRELVETLLAALLFLLPPLPVSERACVASRREEIISTAIDISAQHQVPPAVILVVGLLESHYGCSRGSGGCWGAPTSPTRRHVAGTPSQAARSLSTGFRGNERTGRFRGCGTWVGAVSWFRCGRCRCPARPGYTADYAVGLVGRMSDRAGVARPGSLARREAAP